MLFPLLNFALLCLEIESAVFVYVAFFDDWREGGASHQIVPTFDCVLQKQRRWELNLREKITCS